MDRILLFTKPISCNILFFHYLIFLGAFQCGRHFLCFGSWCSYLLFYQIFQKTWQRKWLDITLPILQLITAILLLHSVFYINWGLNYYRIPLQKQLGLDTVILDTKDHLVVLDKY